MMAGAPNPSGDSRIPATSMVNDFVPGGTWEPLSSAPAWLVLRLSKIVLRLMFFLLMLGLIAQTFFDPLIVLGIQPNAKARQRAFAETQPWLLRLFGLVRPSSVRIACPRQPFANSL